MNANFRMQNENLPEINDGFSSVRPNSSYDFKDVDSCGFVGQRIGCA
jgi:hypothetical protein